MSQQLWVVNYKSINIRSMNLKQAKEQGKLDQFINEYKHIKCDGSKFEKLFNCFAIHTNNDTLFY